MPVTNYYSVNGQIYAEETNGVRTDYLTDPLGSVIGTMNAAGQLVNTYRYKPYGGLLAKTGAGADPSFQWVGSLGYRQTGKRWSDVYVRARHDDTQTGTWGTKDPLAPWEPPYAYGGGRPELAADVSGLTCLLKHPCLAYPGGPCEYARSQGGYRKAIGLGAVGCIVCCEGYPYPCNVRSKPPKPGKEPARGVHECVIGHERRHKERRNDCKGVVYFACVDAQTSMKQHEKEECYDAAYSWRCLMQNRRDPGRCKGDRKCLKAYACWMCSQCGAMEYFCKAGIGSYYPPGPYKGWCDKNCTEALRQECGPLLEGTFG